MSDNRFPSQSSGLLIEGPEGQLELQVDKVEDASAIAVICHPHPLYGGTMTNKVVHTAAKAFNELGADSVRFNFRSIGKSTGSYADGIGEQEDLVAVVEWVREHNPHSPIWLAGFSFGAFIAAVKANELTATELLLIAPAVHHFGFSDIEAFDCPVLVIQGEHDEIVPAQQVYDWCHLRSNLKLIKFADTSHFFHGQLVALKDTIIKEYA